MGEFMVIIEDSDGNVFVERWNKSTKKHNAIKWTLDYDNLDKFINTDKIIKVTIHQD